MALPTVSPTEADAAPLTFHFRYFKGFADATLRLTEPVTLLIGRNGAGKSNTMEGIHLLSQLASGLPLTEVTDLDQEGPCEIRGGLDGCPTLGENFFVLGCELGGARYELAVRPDPVGIDSETLEVAGQECFTCERDPKAPPEAGRPVRINQHWVPEAPDSATARLDVPFLRGYLAVRSSWKGNLEEPLHSLYGLSAAVYFLDPHPRALRRYSRAGAVGRRPLSHDGHNLAAVLYELRAQKGAEALRPIVELLQQVPEERFADLDFVLADKTRDVMLALKRENGMLVDARVLSDGTLRLLADLAALETLPQGALLLLEDYDGGLHPSRVKLLTETLWERCKARGIRVLATTHNPAALSALTDEQLRGVVVCHYDAKIGAAKLTPLLDLPDADLLLSEGPLGELATQNRIESHLDQGYGEKRRSAALKWLETL